MPLQGIMGVEWEVILAQNKSNEEGPENQHCRSYSAQTLHYVTAHPLTTYAIWLEKQGRS